MRSSRSPLPHSWSTRPSPIISLSSLSPALPLPSLLHSSSPSNLRRDPRPSPAVSHVFRLQRRRDGPLLRLPRGRRGARLLLHGRGVRDGQERGGGGVDGGDAAGAGDEVHRARRHGRSARDLRPHHRRHHLHRDQPQGQALLPLRRLRAPLLRPRLRPRGPRRRHGHRHRRRRRRQGQRTAAQAVRRNDPHPHLCRGTCPVWPHRRHHPLLACWPIPRRLEQSACKQGAHGPSLYSVSKGLFLPRDLFGITLWFLLLCSCCSAKEHNVGGIIGISTPSICNFILFGNAKLSVSTRCT